MPRESRLTLRRLHHVIVVRGIEWHRIFGICASAANERFITPVAAK